MIDKDGDTVVMSVTNLDDLPYFTDFDYDYSMFSFAP
jgi:hypothetical protein